MTTAAPPTVTEIEEQLMDEASPFDVFQDRWNMVLLKGAFVEQAKSPILYNRPYQAYVSEESLDTLTEFKYRQPGTTFKPADVATLTPELIKPSQTVNGYLPLPPEHRMTFVLEFAKAEDLNDMFIVQGYTKEPGDHPENLCVINSITHIGVVKQPNGTFKRMMLGSHQVIHDAYGNTVGVDNYDPYSALFTARPSDLFALMEGQYSLLGDQYTDAGNINSINDTRNQVTEYGIFSNRFNNIPANYASSILNQWTNANNIVSVDPTYTTPASMARSASSEPALIQSPFIKFLNSITGENTGKAVVPLGLIKSMTTPDRLLFINKGMPEYDEIKVNHNPNVFEQKEDSSRDLNCWSLQNIETQAATMLATSISSIALELLIKDIYFKITTLPGGQYIITILGGNVFTDMDATPFFDAFKYRVMNEIIPSISVNGVYPLFVDGSFSFAGESFINIGMESEAIKHRYTIPTYCDSIFSPVVSVGQQPVNDLVQEVDTVVNNLLYS